MGVPTRYKVPVTLASAAGLSPELCDFLLDIPRQSSTVDTDDTGQLSLLETALISYDYCLPCQCGNLLE